MTKSPRRRARSARLAATVSVLTLVATAAAFIGPTPASADSPICLVATGPVPPGCVTSLSFGQQPTATTAGQEITPAVTVIARDNSGNPAPLTNVTIRLGRNPSGATLFGTRTQTADSNGVATFPDLIINKAGTGFTLVAVAGSSLLSPKPSATSTQFDISGVASNCTSSPCVVVSPGGATNPTSADSTRGKASVPVGACTQAPCFMSLDESAGAFCDGICIGNALLIVPPSNASGNVTVDLAYDKSIAKGVGVANFRIFKEDETGAVIEIFNCPQVPPTADQIPCVTKRSRTGVGDLIITLVMSPVDPRIGTGLIER